MHSFSKNLRNTVISITSKRMAESVFYGDEHTKELCLTRWNEYRTSLNSEERAVAVETYDSRIKELANGQ